MGGVKYPADFGRFDYVNPEAPKGGRVRLSANGSFDTFNFVVPKGQPAIGLGFMYDSLTTSSSDEVATDYGLIAEAHRYPEDYSWVEYRLNPNAKWHDGKPITAEDVVWSFDVLTTNNPSRKFYYRHVSGAEVRAGGIVRFTFDQTGNRELPHIVGQLQVLPKHYWEAEGRDILQSTLEPPLGSGPYRIKSFQAGRTIVYERVPDYWAKDLNVNIGKHNLGEMVFEYFRDSTAMLEAFKGDQLDFRRENSAKNWATAYDFPAVKDGRVALEEFPDNASGIMQSFVVNLRREKFRDPRVRRALNLAFDYETLNRTLFFDQYKRVDSFFAGTELASTGVPEGLELEILETVRGQVPEEVFTTAYANPLGGDPGKVRTNLREAVRLFAEAGWTFKDRKLVNATTGEPFEIEYLTADPNFERVVLAYKQNLERIGIAVTIRTVDASQYINRRRAFDFDMITASWGQSLSPGNEQLFYWGSEAANNSASQNFAGIENPAIDALIQRVIFAKDRDELVAATKALDRVLLWNEYVIPQWYTNSDRTARWDRFAYPDPLPKYSFGFPTIWWWDDAKASRMETTQ
ncbi:MAG: extracellular solute-binding protein [Pseudomonadota bacterium]